MSKILITLGIVLIAVGLLWPLVQRLGLGRLPGDIVVERDDLRLYIPIVTCLVISAVLSVLWWWFGR